MNLLLILAGTVLPLLPLLLAPARTIGRGGAWKYVGAAMLVGLMMLIFFGMQDMTGDDGKAPDAAVAGISDADMKALEQILR